MAENEFIQDTQTNDAGTETGVVDSFISAIPVPEAPAGSGHGGQGGASAMITNPVDGTQVRRTDYIKALASNGWQRGDIVRHLQELGHEVRYQTVYQATEEFFPKRNSRAGASEPQVAGANNEANEANEAE